MKDTHGLVPILISALFFFVSGFVLRFCMSGREILGLTSMGVSALIVIFYLLIRNRSYIPAVIAAVLLVAGTAVFCVAVAPVISEAKTDRDPKADYIIVLGAGLHGDVPSVTMQNRIDAALEYMDRYPEAKAIVSGGQGSNENTTEAFAMKKGLVQGGIEASRIIEEGRSTSTMENLRFSFDIIRALGDEPSGKVAIVSSEYHLRRAKLIAESLGVEAKGVAAHTTLPLMKVNYFIREGFAAVYIWFFGVK